MGKLRGLQLRHEGKWEVVWVPILPVGGQHANVNYMVNEIIRGANYEMGRKAREWGWGVVDVEEFWEAEYKFKGKYFDGSGVHLKGVGWKGQSPNGWTGAEPSGEQVLAGKIGTAVKDCFGKGGPGDGR